MANINDFLKKNKNNAAQAQNGANNNAFSSKKAVWQPRVLAAYDNFENQENNIVQIYITSFPHQLINNINQSLSSVTGADGSPLMTFKKGKASGQDVIILSYNKANEEDFLKRGLLYIQYWMSEVNKLFNAGQSPDGFNVESVKEFPTHVKDRLEDTISAEEMKSINTEITSNWKKMLEYLESSDFRDMLLSYQTTQEFEDKFASVLHHGRLSKGNVFRVRMADPMASFVTTPSAWRNYFKRRVLPNAVYVQVERLINPKFNAAKANKFATSLNYTDTADMVSSGDYTNQVDMANRKYQGHTAHPDFIGVKMVDVRFTEPIDPNDDPWTKEIGLQANVFKKVNKAGVDFLKKQGILSADYTEEVPQEEKTEEEAQQEMLSVLKVFNRKFTALAKNIQMPGRSMEHGDHLKKAIQNITAYANWDAAQKEYVKPDRKEAFVSAIIAVMAKALNLPPTNETTNAISITKRTMQNPSFAEDVARDSFSAVWTLINLIPDPEMLKTNEKQAEQPMVNENKLTKSEVIDLIRSTLGLSTRQTIKEQFDNFLGRMNNLYKD